MSESPKFPKIVIRQKDGVVDGTISTGATTVIEIDGQPIKYCTAYKVEGRAGSITKVTLEMVGHVEVQVLGELQTKIMQLKPTDGE